RCFLLQRPIYRASTLVLHLRPPPHRHSAALVPPSPNSPQFLLHNPVQLLHPSQPPAPPPHHSQIATASLPSPTLHASSNPLYHPPHALPCLQEPIMLSLSRHFLTLTMRHPSSSNLKWATLLSASANPPRLRHQLKLQSSYRHCL